MELDKHKTYVSLLHDQVHRLRLVFPGITALRLKSLCCGANITRLALLARPPHGAEQVKYQAYGVIIDGKAVLTNLPGVNGKFAYVRDLSSIPPPHGCSPVWQFACTYIVGSPVFRDYVLMDIIGEDCNIEKPCPFVSVCKNVDWIKANLQQQHTLSRDFPVPKLYLRMCTFLTRNPISLKSNQ
uniref:Uncharacterized protein n=1 Tax=Glossina austeni TaxID=7395 RepID=A0A1A9VI05_GLOAU